MCHSNRDKIIELYYKDLKTIIDITKNPAYYDHNYNSQFSYKAALYNNSLCFEINELCKNFSLILDLKEDEYSKISFKEEKTNSFQTLLSINKLKFIEDYKRKVYTSSYNNDEFDIDGYHEGLAYQLREGHIEMSDLSSEDQDIIRGTYGQF